MAATDARPRVSLALQGGGAHGAFAWGVLDRLLEDGRLAIEAISGTSAGSAQRRRACRRIRAGRRRRRAQGARVLLVQYERIRPVPRPSGARSPDRIVGHWNLDHSPGYFWFNLFGPPVLPYQTNPLKYQPLREILARQIDIAAVRACEADQPVRHCRPTCGTGRARIFDRKDLSLDALLASACLPHLYQAVEIDGEPYWDGGYMGNPAIWPLIYNCSTADVVLVQVNPLVREDVPRTPAEIGTA